MGMYDWQGDWCGVGSDEDAMLELDLLRLD